MMLWLVGLLIVAGGAGATYVVCPGCIDRERVNETCEWVGDTPFSFDRQNAFHRQHLVADAQLAEELAIRHADAEAGRRTGIDHHGGLLDQGHFRNACLSRMFSEIEVSHTVAPDEVRVARGQRNLIFDVAVALLFLPLYMVAVLLAARRLSRRFASDGWAVRAIATIVVSAIGSGLGLQAFPLWGAVWEVVRVGNGHMTSIRAATQDRWINHYVDVAFVGGMVVFCLIVWCCFKLAREGHPASRGPSGLSSSLRV
jgi:hypothetical protein